MQHVAAARAGILGAVFAIPQIGHALPCQREHRGPLGVGQGELPAFRRLDGIGGPEQKQVGHGPQAGQVLDRLMGRAVLAEADGIVGHHVDDAELHERRQPDRRPAIVGEGEEGAAEGDDPAVERHAVHHRAHGVLAHPVIEVAAAVVAGRDRRELVALGAVGAREVGRAADEGRQGVGDGADDPLVGDPGGDGGALLGKRGLQARERLRECRGQRARGRPVEFGPLPLVEGSAARLPGFARSPAPLAKGAPGGEDRVRHREGRVRPAQRLAGARDLVRPKRRAMARGGAGLGRRAVADHRAALDHRGPGLGLGRRDGRRHRVGIVAIDAQRVPAGGLEARPRVVGAGEAGGAVDGDVVGIVEHDQAVEPQVTGERDRLLADAFHQAAVAADHIGVMVHKVRTEAGGHAALRQRHADRVGETLAERAGGGLDPGGEAVLRMAGGAAAELAEVADLVDVDVRIPGEVEQRIEQHRAVTVGQHEAVAVGPVGARGIELEEAAEEHGRDVGEPQRHAGMAGAGLLHRIHRKGANGVRHVRVFDARCAPFSHCGRHGLPSCAAPSRRKVGATCPPPG